MVNKLLNKQTIEYCINYCSSKQNFIIVEGYAFSSTLKDIEFKIVDNDNKNIEIIYARKKMFDTGNDNKDYSGFFIKFNANKNKKYFLILKDNINYIKVSLLYQSTKTFLKKSVKYAFSLLTKNKFKYLFKNIVYILKNKNNINIKDIVNQLNTQSVTKKELQQQENTIFSYMPKVSVICDAVSDKTIKSIKEQSYKNIEICSSVNNDINKLINSSLGDVLVFVEQDTILEPNTIFEIVKAFNIDNNIDFVYCDEDRQTENNYRIYVKNDFNIDLLRTHNYIGTFFAIKKSITNNIDTFVQKYDYILNSIELSKKIYRIPKILVHLYNYKDFYNSMNKRIIENHLKRCGLDATIIDANVKGYYIVDYKIQSNDLVSIIILNKDNKKQLEICINSILEKTKYQNYEIIIVENNSTTKEIFEYYKSLESNKKIKLITGNCEFNYSKLNNYAVKKSNGKYLVFLNNDTKIIESLWLDIMLANIQRKDVGIVGAKLLYSNNTIQHYGLTLTKQNNVDSNFINMNYNDIVNYNRLNLQQDVDAVTGACCMISRKIFDSIKGFDENLAIAFNDIDLCLKIKQLNKLVMIDPRILLYHYESKTRGYESTIEKVKRFEKEQNYFNNKLKTIYLSRDLLNIF